MSKKVVNILLLVTFLITALAPVTGMTVHKLASVLFLLLSILHAFQHRKRLGAKAFALLGLSIVAFVSGVLAMIFKEHSAVLIAHKVLSIAVVAFLAIHIFVYRKALFNRRKQV